MILKEGIQIRAHIEQPKVSEKQTNKHTVYFVHAETTTTREKGPR